jgi:hypothetical protein
MEGGESIAPQHADWVEWERFDVTGRSFSVPAETDPLPIRDG